MSYLELLRLSLPEVVVTATALIVLAISLTNARSGAFNLSRLVAAIGLVIAIVMTLKLPQNAVFGAGMLVVSPLTSLFKIICIVLALFTVVLNRSAETGEHAGEFLAVVLFATVGLMLLVGSEELLMIFIGLELTGISLYVMTAFNKDDARSAEAGMKYFLFGSTSSAFTLFGISLVYGMTGTTTLAGIAQRLAATPVEPLLAVGIVMTLIAFAFKIAVAPFHLWAPDTYQGAPISSAAFIASGSKVAAFVVLGKIVTVGFAPAQGSAAWHAMAAGWAPVLAILCALSILLGNFVALAQTNVRRLLAYSAVAHGGYTLLGLIIGGRNGFAATLFYTTIYAFTLIGAFAVVGAVRRDTGGDDLKNFSGLSARSPLLAACMSIFMLSLAGLPPLAGFFGKFYLFSAALGAQGPGKSTAFVQPTILWLVAVALFGTLISLYYYLMILKAIYVDERPDAKADEHPLGGSDLLQKSTVALLAGIVLFLGIMPGTLTARILASLP